MTLTLARPHPDEYHQYYARYLDPLLVDDARPLLERRFAPILALASGLDDAGACARYAPGKWSIKEVLGHVADTERIFAYRALRFGRGDATAVPGFDEKTFVASAGTDRRPLASIVDDLTAVRAASLTLLDSFTPEMLELRGEASGYTMSVRALFWSMAGHEQHHETMLRQRYGLGAASASARG
ncbi:MAG TPA: DinB family protein [Candidatus Udaeobacter sp.]|jgi:hypothetical protein|nr:DinB family protein [Candidatus Udaeobacter sp.]